MTSSPWARVRVLSVFGALAAVGLVAGCGGPTASPDGGGGDSGPVDAGRECAADATCDDGLFCNGAEHCSEAGRCVAGRAPSCDDGIACTTDSCSEALRACRSTPPDRDGDGAADAACTDGVTPLGNDCADDDANRFPGNPEVCDGDAHDEDCDTATHGATDHDADGHESRACCNGTECGDDCDDSAASAHPGGTEACNHVDDDCDGNVDEGSSVAGFVDADRDGYGDPTMPMTACSSASGFSADGTDCDDSDRARHPAQPELCDGRDNDCDGNTDETPSVVSWYEDADGDGFGSATGTIVRACEVQAGRSLYGTDCDDHSVARGPGAAEVCNGIDDDCNGLADFVIDAGNLEDDDRDGLADAMCGAPLGVDCDDRDPAAGPGQPELCNRRDDDCDGHVDEGATAVAFYGDADGDGYGTEARISIACTPPPGFARRGGDCDDSTTTVGSATHPGAPEVCDGADEDCDGAVDEAEAQTSCRTIDPHAVMACVAGACESYGCQSGYAACGETGCDDLSTDTRHCGSCTNRCASGEDCIRGTCLAQPSSCAELRLRSPSTTATDGAYTIYFGGATDRPFTAYCLGMATASPRTYLTLPNGPATNTSGYDATLVGGTTVTTLWTRVRLTGMSLDPSDYTFSSSTGSVVHEMTTQVPYGVARDCSGGAPLGHAHVDLRGTPFAVSASSWLLGGFAPTGSTTTASFEQEADIIGGGFCGWNAPSADRFGGVPLPLRWCPAPGPETYNALDDDCDGIVDDGCPQPGSLGISFNRTWGPFGGSGGGGFGDNCPPGQALVGLAGAYGGNIDRLYAHCGNLVVRESRASTPFTYSVGVDPGSDLSVHGMNFTTSYDLRCPADTVVIDVDVQGDSSVTAVTIRCAALVLGGSIGAYTLTRGGAVSSFSVTGSGGGSTRSTSSVAPGVISGIFGQSGFWMDALGLYEATVSVPLQ